MRIFLLAMIAILVLWSGFEVYKTSADLNAPKITTNSKPDITSVKPVTAESKPSELEPVELLDEIAPEIEEELDAPAGVVNVLAPCPDKIYACFGALANNIVDSNCPAYKPVWAYYSKNEGDTWIRVGCYATEIDAEQALERVRKGAEPVLAKTKSVLTEEEELLLEETEFNQVFPPVAETETLVKSEPEKLKEVKAEISPSEEVVEKAVEETSTEVAEVKAEETPVKVAPKKEEYKADFKGGLGLVFMTSRKYPSEKMRDEALRLWDIDMRLLEPNGEINEKYMLKAPATPPMPGHY